MRSMLRHGIFRAHGVCMQLHRVGTTLPATAAWLTIMRMVESRLQNAFLQVWAAGTERAGEGTESYAVYFVMCRKSMLLNMT